LAPTLATWPVETPQGAKAPDLRNIVCNGRKLAKLANKEKGKRPALGPGHRMPAKEKPAKGNKKKPIQADAGGSALRPR
jgi:D-alanyl-D-alanine carboxypeptidase